jgi:hypothetical protein
MNRKLATLAAAIFCTMMLASPALRADTVTINLLSNTINLASGTTGHFYANAFAPSSNLAAEYLNGLEMGSLDAGLSDNEDNFFVNWPLSLDPNTSYMPAGFFDVFFDITVAPNVAVGTVLHGTYDLLGGGDGNAQNVIATGNFTVNVTPEPGSLLLMGTGLVGAIGTLRRKLRA